ncbi:MAG: NAD-dependent epimerase/dehydratase family protein [Chloroflexota bacterium]|nr:NAD-dependent epimerase/dehydratase family protein [Dehalococcoidia bacterium]MDW8254331.1 NAD-dependent epimerase/dehydratase family protein [Chloroflexota bacterium]
MHVLVTGAAGFIGSHLVDALLAAGHTVVGLDSLVPQVHPTGEWPAYINREARWIRGDVRNPDVVAAALEGVEAIVHLAAVVGVGQSMYQIRRYVEENNVGAAVVLEAAVARRDQIRKLIVASSMSLYGEGRYLDSRGRPITPRPRSEAQLRAHDWTVYGPDGQPATPIPTDEEKTPHPTSVYAVSKRDQEELFLAVGGAYNIPTVALRFFNVYGPRQALSNPYTGVAAIFSARLLAGRPPVIYEDGEQTRDFVHVSDIVQAALLALERAGGDGHVINVGTGRATTIREVADTLARVLGRPIEPEITGRFRAGDIRHCIADIGRARQLLGYEPRVTFEAGMAQLAEWVAEQPPDDRFDEARQALETRRLIR